MKTEKQILDKIKELEETIRNNPYYEKSIITKQALEWVLEIE